MRKKEWLARWRAGASQAGWAKTAGASQKGNESIITVNRSVRLKHFFIKMFFEDKYFGIDPALRAY
jgi:hypothetical protein